jgi:hypothetical protein
MSVIVKGMEMPNHCGECRFVSHDWCYGVCEEAGAFLNFKVRPDWCPLCPLPEKHGRLIDGDELAGGCDAPHWCRWLSEIEDMPTIVEAEGDD